MWATFCHATSTDERPQQLLVLLTEGTRYRADARPTPYKRTHSSVGGSREASERSIRATLSRRPADPLIAWAHTDPNESLHSKVWAKCPKTGFVCVHAFCLPHVLLWQNRASSGHRFLNYTGPVGQWFQSPTDHRRCFRNKTLHRNIERP